jgi:hypothetical protein
MVCPSRMFAKAANARYCRCCGLHSCGDHRINRMAGQATRFGGNPGRSVGPRKGDHLIPSAMSDDDVADCSLFIDLPLAYHPPRKTLHR